jgi:hypothetical protein
MDLYRTGQSIFSGIPTPENEDVVRKVEIRVQKVK